MGRPFRMSDGPYKGLVLESATYLTAVQHSEDMQAVVDNLIDAEIVKDGTKHGRYQV
jgi:hypothetical protein